MYVNEDRTPYYIGKGSGERINRRHKNVTLPPEERRIILKYFNVERDSFQHEKYMIHILGRLSDKTGTLKNVTSGGQGKTGFKLTAERINHLTQCRLDGNVYTEEFGQKISQTLKRKGIKPPTQKGKKWYYCEDKTTLSYEHPGEGWKLGRPSVKNWK